MAHPFFITDLRISKFGCVKDAALKLSPLHALIGPNDSGKSTILRAVRTAMQLLVGHFQGNILETDPSQSCRPFHPGLHENASVEITLSDVICYNVKITEQENIEETLTLSTAFSDRARRRLWEESTLPRNVHLIRSQITPEQLQQAGLPADFGPHHSSWRVPSKHNRYESLVRDLMAKGELNSSLSQRVHGIPRMVRLDPDSLRMPGGLIPSSQAIDLQENGLGLASIYDSLIMGNLDGFVTIRERIQRLFPTASTISLRNISATQKLLVLKLRDGTEVPAQFMSEGLLYYLAFAALQFLEPSSILLVEEPENGLHPSRIKDIVAILREISMSTQVLLATHSPLVINELMPDEVTVVWRDDEKGAMLNPIRETKNFEERSKVYALGELWLSYADGISERPLREGAE